MASRKIMLLGEIAVGKTSLARRAVMDTFANDYKATVGVDLYRYAADIGDGRVLDLVIWDTDGDFGESIFAHIYCRGAVGALILGDATRPETFSSVEILSHGFRSQFPGRPVELIANKCDLVADGDKIDLPADSSLMPESLRHTSAKTGHAVREAFDALAADIDRRGL